MKKSVIMSRTYCQLLKVWIGQRGVCSWQKQCVNGLHGQFAIQPSYDSVRSLCTDTTSGDADTPQIFPTFKNEIVNIEKKFRVKENNVLKHGSEDLGLFYTTDTKSFEKFYKHGQNNNYVKQVLTFRECGVMVRKPALEVFDMVHSVDMDLPPTRVLLYGKYGVGKSMTLSHVVHRYATEGFVTVHFPDIKRKIKYRPHRPRKFHLSDDETKLEHTFDAKIWLILFKLQNENKLDGLTVQEGRVFSAREKIEAGAPITDIIEFGLARSLFASECIGLLLKELRLAATEKKIKVLVALDGANVFWKDLTVRVKTKYPVQMCSMFRHFMDMFQPTWNNGLIVSTLCSDVAAVDVPGLSPRKMDTSPYGILGKEGFKFMDPFIPVEVTRYSKEEAINCLDYYIDNHWITLPEGKTRQGKEELMALSAKYPIELMDICNYW